MVLDNDNQSLNPFIYSHPNRKAEVCIEMNFSLSSSLFYIWYFVHGMYKFTTIWIFVWIVVYSQKRNKSKKSPSLILFIFPYLVIHLSEFSFPLIFIVYVTQAYENFFFALLHSHYFKLIEY
jgi:hypothetical protein